MPYKIWSTGEIVTSAGFNDYLQEQVVPTFTNSANRATLLPSPNAGQLSYLIDTRQYAYWDGTGWRVLPMVAGSLLTTCAGGAAVTGITTPAMLTGSVMTVVVPAPAYVDLIWSSISLQSTAADNTAFAQVWKDGVVADLSQWEVVVPVANQEFRTNIVAIGVPLAAGTFVFDIRAQRITGAGTVTGRCGVPGGSAFLRGWQ